MFPPLPTQLPHPPRGMLHPGAMRMPARPYRPHGLYGPYGYPNRVGYGYAPHPYPPRGAPPLPVPRPPFTPKQVLSRPAEKGIPQVAVDKKTEKKPSRTAIEAKEEQKETRQRVETCTPQQLEKVVVNDAWARYASSGNETDSSKASVWMVSPEDLAGIMNHEGAGNLRAQRGIKAGSSSSDSRGSLKKYFGLPFLHEFRSDGNESDRQPLERATCDSDTSAQVQSNVPGVSLDYRKLFGPGQVTTPFTSQCFQPQKYYDELIPTYGDLEQIPPHMSWRPGDWKCAKCGNHNFSYRGLCKRCREGRFEDAGFVFPVRL